MSANIYDNDLISEVTFQTLKVNPNNTQKYYTEQSHLQEEPSLAEV